MPDARSILVGEWFPVVDKTVISQIAVKPKSRRILVRDVSHVFGVPAVSPDGRRVAFVSSTGIETVLLASGERTLVIGLGSSLVSALAWSPDGKELGYVAAARADEPSSLYVVKANGSDRRMISKPGESVASFDWRPEATTD
jgi:Tol biopolymer transport system component